MTVHQSLSFIIQTLPSVVLDWLKPRAVRMKRKNEHQFEEDETILQFGLCGFPTLSNATITLILHLILSCHYKIFPNAALSLKKVILVGDRLRWNLYDTSSEN